MGKTANELKLPVHTFRSINLETKKSDEKGEKLAAAATPVLAAIRKINPNGRLAGYPNLILGVAGLLPADETADGAAAAAADEENGKQKPTATAAAPAIAKK